MLILRQKICQKISPGVSFGIFGDFRYNLGFIFKIHALVSLEHCKNDSEIEPFEFWFLSTRARGGPMIGKIVSKFNAPVICHK